MDKSLNLKKIKRREKLKQEDRKKLKVC